MFIISLYAPTHRAAAEVKEKFYDYLQAVVSLVPSRDVLLVMGELSVRVNCANKSTSETLWAGVQGSLGLVGSMKVVRLCSPSVLLINCV